MEYSSFTLHDSHEIITHTALLAIITPYYYWLTHTYYILLRHCFWADYYADYCCHMLRHSAFRLLLLLRATHITPLIAIRAIRIGHFPRCRHYATLRCVLMAIIAIADHYCLSIHYITPHATLPLYASRLRYADIFIIIIHYYTLLPYTYIPVTPLFTILLPPLLHIADWPLFHDADYHIH